MPRPLRERESPSKSARRRDDLIDRLIQLFLDEGFAEMSLEDMARELRCSKTTLYTVAGSKEQIINTVVSRFFRKASVSVEAPLRVGDDSPLDRIRVYLMAIAAALAPASATFFADIDSMPVTREIYRDNTRIAARRLQELVLEAVPATSRVEAVFVGTVAGQIMEAIHRGEIETATGLDDSGAYRALANLIVAGLAASADTPHLSS
jgi:AcrR family transcriptional regulator